MNSSITISFTTLLLTFFNFLCKQQILCGYSHSFYKIIISASRHLKNSAHLTYGILLSVTIGYMIFYSCSHFLPVSERKSRISSFSISNALILASFRTRIYFSSATLSCSLTTYSFGGLPLRFNATPAVILRCFSLYLLMKLCICS